MPLWSIPLLTFYCWVVHMSVCESLSKRKYLDCALAAVPAAVVVYLCLGYWYGPMLAALGHHGQAAYFVALTLFGLDLLRDLLSLPRRPFLAGPIDWSVVAAGALIFVLAVLPVYFIAALAAFG